MVNFVWGLTLGLLGAAVFLGSASARPLGFDQPCSETVYCDPILASLGLVGFLVMFAAPLLFWVVAPGLEWLNRHLPSRFRDEPPPGRP